jgi:hypothetical protein
MSGLPAYLAETALGLAVFYGLHRVLLRHDTHFRLNRLYLVGSLLAAHLVPLVPVPSPFRREAEVLLVPELADVGTVAAVSWAWTDALFALYFLGAGTVVLRLSWHLFQLARLLRRGEVADCGGQRVVLVDDDVPPFSFLGMIFVHRPPDGRRDALAQVIAHEATHVRQHHSLDILLVQAAAAFQWFNPFVWLYRDALRDVHEYLADRDVLARGHDPAIYTRVLLDQHFGGPTLEFAHQLRHSQIRRRLDMMTRQSGPWAACRYLLALPVLAMLVFACAEPQAATPGSGVAMVADRTLPDYAQAEVKQAKPDQATDEEKKAAQLELKKKYTALLKEYETTTDPERKKLLGQKIAQFEQTYGMKTMKVDLSDPVAVEEVITKLSAKMKAIEQKSNETTDPEIQAKIRQDLDGLSKKIQELKAVLAQLQAAKPK